jgi:RHS repeat-associated protein
MHIRLFISDSFFGALKEQPEYDLDGNMTNDGRFSFTWDSAREMMPPPQDDSRNHNNYRGPIAIQEASISRAEENRLLTVQSLSSSPQASWRKVTWEFDGKGRRIRQTGSDGSSGSYVVTDDLKFLADGWRHVAELNATNNALVRSYLWGLDLSGTTDGAGGVGGLILMNSVANGVHFAMYDGNGNVAGLAKASDGTASANYEYGPFGETLRATGVEAREMPFRFSTKRTDKWTDLVLYEYRVYASLLGTWLSQDPKQEVGGINMYAFCENGATGTIDPLGLCGEPGGGQNNCRCGPDVSQLVAQTGRA